MENCARLWSYLPKVTVLAVEAANTVQSKDTTGILLLAIENGVAHQKLRSAKKRAHNSSSSTSMAVARL